VIPQEILSTLFGPVCPWANQCSEDPAGSLHISHRAIAVLDFVEIGIHTPDKELDCDDLVARIDHPKNERPSGPGVCRCGRGEVCQGFETDLMGLVG